jgi:hypothetical protein
MSDTPLLGLPLIEAAQAQKHITHNEALLLLDAAIHLSVASRGTAAPPAMADDGARYLVAAVASGAWAGREGNIAIAQGGGWLFASPRKGWRMWVEDEAKFLLFDGAAWREPGGGGQAMAEVPKLGINAAADDANRLAVSSSDVLFSHAGAGLRMKLNKNAAGDTASLIYQSGWSGRAEMGLAGDDDFRIKVSADGAAWAEAIRIDRASGAVSLPNTPPPEPGARMLFNQALAAQGPGFAAETYLAGSQIAIPADALRAGSRYRLVFDASKTAAGTAAPVVRLRFGTAGSLADAVLGTLTFSAQTAAGDDGRFMLDVTFRTTGAAAVAQICGALTHSLASAGFANVPGLVRRATSPAFNSALADAVIGVSVTAGTAAAWTVWQVQASLENIN